MNTALAPILNNEVRRVEIAVEDSTIMRLSSVELDEYCAGISAVVNEALRLGLHVTQFRDQIRLSDMIVITRETGDQ